MAFESIDPFVANGFTMRTMSNAIVEMPLQWGILQQLGIFRPMPIRTRTVGIQREAYSLALLPFKDVGSPGTPGKTGSRDLVPVTVPHIPHDDFVHPDDVANLRDENGELMALSRFIALKLQTMSGKHDITIEHLMAGAIQGKIYDADGTLKYDLFSILGRTQSVIDFPFSVSTTNVRSKILDAKIAMEEALGGEVFTSYLGLCGATWFKTFIDHQDVKTRYENWQSNAELRRDNRTGFDFVDVFWQMYRAHAPKPDGTDLVFLPDTEAVLIPVGTMNTFDFYMSPADMNPYVNTLGQRVYASIEPADHQRGWNIHTQSNPLPFCKRPQCLIRLTMS